ncbi:MAG TPA: LssY C-terminal domain-containing protein, partial [Gemmataceae bacterium]|nr:LssY C-terminal domain-containing protein [Gemmataceae bacterium]
NPLKWHWLGVPYKPRPDAQPFLERAEVRQDDALVVRLAVLDDRESERFFGVPLARRGIQPVWLHVKNIGEKPYRLRLASLDRNYFPPLEAAYACHYAILKRLVGFGMILWIIVLALWPILILLPFKLFAVRAANRRMNEYFQAHGIGWGIIRPGAEASGFVFTTLDEGTKQVTVRLVGPAGARDYSFSVPIPGLRVDYGGKPFDVEVKSAAAVECDEADLRRRLAAMPRSTTNRRGMVEGDPLNLVAIGDFATILGGFGARWDETEIISFRSCVRTFKAFILGSNYRYSPVSSLYVGGRHQDFALQKTRHSINERLHLRLWLTPLRLGGKPVWIGQISRDIGVRFTFKTWNLTTHKIDPDVDDARDFVVDDLAESGRVSHVARVPGAGAAPPTAPRHNLTGDPYFTDGFRAVVVFSDAPTTTSILDWE